MAACDCHTGSYAKAYKTETSRRRLLQEAATKGDQMYHDQHAPVRQLIFGPPEENPVIESSAKDIAVQALRDLGDPDNWTETQSAEAAKIVAKILTS